MDDQDASVFYVVVVCTHYRALSLYPVDVHDCRLRLLSFTCCLAKAFIYAYSDADEAEYGPLRREYTTPVQKENERGEYFLRHPELLKVT